ncbi:hypothetical protein GDO81_017598 [Engystomops pustulosus]|uniref:Uncharacterized protein n=1 Tax=Engystomops pustulosus TaxID=76066 RepID=A0AAV7A347_ENGPU|nr:hypothetical protein GDO81_017598 [Engystomops pustulosus]
MFFPILQISWRDPGPACIWLVFGTCSDLKGIESHLLFKAAVPLPAFRLQWRCSCFSNIIQQLFQTFPVNMSSWD